MIKRRDGLGRFIDQLDLDYLFNTDEFESYVNKPVRHMRFPNYYVDEFNQIHRY